MSVTINANSGSTNGYQVNQNGIFLNNKEKRSAENTIFGGNLKPLQDPVEARKKQAQEKAYQVVKDAFANDRSVDDTIQARKDHYAEMSKARDEATAQLKDIQKMIEESEEERPDLVDQANKFRKDIEDANKQMRDDVSDVKQIRLERLKTHPMVDAEKEADSILDAANDDIKGMLVEDAVDNIDKKQEENEEKAKDASDEKKEKEEQLEAAEEKRAVQEALILRTKEAIEEAKSVQKRNEAPDMEMEDMIDLTKITTSGSGKDVKQSLDDIKSSMKVLEADLKGIKVDQEA